MPPRYMVKKVDGMWELFPIRHWLGRLLGMSRLKSTDKWIWQTRFSTWEQAYTHARAWAATDTDGVGFPHCEVSLQPRNSPSHVRRARRMGWSG